MGNASDDFQQLKRDIFAITSKPWNPNDTENPPPGVQAETLIAKFLETHNRTELGFFDRRELESAIKDVKENRIRDAGSGAQIDKGGRKGPETPRIGWLK